MKKILCLGILASLMLVQTSIAYAVKYIESPPLTEAIKIQVGPVNEGTMTNVPIITWGGDIATIFGNGNTIETKKDSIFHREGLRIKLFREDDFKKQLELYISGKSPYLRGTLGMINMAADLLSDPGIRPVIIYQLTWSNGGDVLVVKEGIKTMEDLRNRTFVAQANGPHVDLFSILHDASLTTKDVKIKWTKDLTGSDNSPAHAFANDANIDAAFVIIPDALALTSGGAVGTGSEDSVKGARILMTTKTANRVIADVYAVRSDYYEKNKKDVQKFVHALMLSEEGLKELVDNKNIRSAEYQQMLFASASILLDSSQATADAEGLYNDCEYVGFGGNVKFFTDVNYPRNFNKLINEKQSFFISMGLLNKHSSIRNADWNYEELGNGLKNIVKDAPKFNEKEVASLVAKKQQQKMMEQGELFSFEIYFEPNQNNFPAELYLEQFKNVVNLASIYGGAIVTIEGHSDPLGYLKSKKRGESQIVLTQVKQAAKNLSLSRAIAVRESLINFAKGENVSLDSSQFTALGHGIMKPKSGMNGDEPKAPANEQEWRNNMRVVFRIIQIEAESSVFESLQ